MVERWSLRLRIFLFFAALAVGSLTALGAGLFLGYWRLADPAALPGFLVGGAVAGFIIVGLITWVWLLFDENVAKPIRMLAGGMWARAHAEVNKELNGEPARYLGDLAPAAAAVASHLARTRSELERAVAHETARLTEEKARLSALLADVPVGVLLVSATHQIVFYNGQARALLGGASGLDRPLFEMLREGPIRHAYERLCRSEDPDAASDLLCATVEEARVLAGRMRLVRAGGPETVRPGYVLTLHDVTADLALHAQREALLAELFDRVRRPAAGLLTLLDAVRTAPEASVRETLQAALAAEAERLVTTVTELGDHYEARRGHWWPMAETRASELIDGIVARLEQKGIGLSAEAEPLLLRCDAFQLVALLTALAERLVAEEGATALSLFIMREEGGALLSLGWTGRPLPVGRLEHWLGAPVEVGVADITGQAVLFNHGTEIWPEPGRRGRAMLNLPLREARPIRPQPDGGRSIESRAAVYDFDLLAKAPAPDLAEARLSALTYVVFDTETTGLLPDEGDEIVQIAAARIVNGREIADERFESLVDPGRAIPPAATGVHGITDDMVAGAPTIAEAGRRFHRFAAGAVLVAHNAPFDLAFLRRHEAEIGARFDHPVLDTVLLSAVVFGQDEAHNLDALAERLGVSLPDEVRHTAPGDAQATAEILLKLLPMLEARGLGTFGAVLEAVRQHGRLLKDLN